MEGMVSKYNVNEIEPKRIFLNNLKKVNSIW